MSSPVPLPQLQQHDSVSVQKIHADIVVGLDAWGRQGKQQPATVSMSLYLPDAIQEASEEDDVAKTVNYSDICKGILQILHDEAGFSTLVALAARMDPTQPDCSWSPGDISLAGWSIDIRLPKALLQSTYGITFFVQRCCAESTSRQVDFLEDFRIKDLQCTCIIGVNEHERLGRQPVSISMTFQTLDRGTNEWPSCASEGPAQTALSCYPRLAEAVTTAVDDSKFQTVEALATFVARIATTDFDIDEITVSVKKPFAILRIEGPVVEITRKKSFFS